MFLNTFWSEWELQEKVDFDGINKLITVYPHVTNLDIRADVWSASVRWLGMLNRGYDRFLEPLERTGLDAIPGGQTGDFYFLTNGWKLQIDFAKTAVTGVLFSRDFDTAYYTFEGTPQFAAQVSSIVNMVATSVNVVTGDIGDVPTSQENANAVWGDHRAVDMIEEIHYIERAVHIDPEAANQGIGTQSNPFNTVEAALDFAELNNLKLLHILSDVTVDRNLKNFVIIGIGTPTIDCNGYNLDRSEFFHCRLKGNYIGKVLVQQSILLNNFQLNGIFEKCPIEGVVDMIGDSLIVGCYSYVGGLGYPVLKISAGEAVFRDYHGSIGVADCTGGTHSIGVASGGRVIIENTNIGGNIHVRGFPFDIVDNSGVGCSVLDETDSKRVRELPRKVWDEVL